MAKKVKGKVRGDAKLENVLKKQGIKKEALKTPKGGIVHRDIKISTLRERSKKK